MILQQYNQKLTWGLICSFFTQLAFNQATSNSQSKCPILQTMESSNICSNISPWIIDLQPVAVTNILAFLRHSSTVVTSKPAKRMSYFYLAKKCQFCKCYMLKYTTFETKKYLYNKKEVKLVPTLYNKSFKSFQYLLLLKQCWKKTLSYTNGKWNFFFYSFQAVQSIIDNKP